ncbi:General transcription factor IIH subunit [Dirofilaria immitis]
MNDDDEPKGYTWEVDYADGLNIRDVLHEDESGSIEKSVAKLILDTKRKKRLSSRPAKVRLGIMRYVYLVIDCSFSMADKSVQPSRLAITIKTLNQFLDKFSEQNPISQVGIVVCKDKRAERLIPLTGNVRLVKESLSTITEAMCHGEFSLHNSLMATIRSLHSYPGHASREVILVVASLSTCDPSSIFGTFELLKRYHIRCSVISLSAEVFVFKKLCSITSGRHNVVLDSTHFEIVLNEHTNPPVSDRYAESSVVRMGFPAHESIDSPSFCLCHQSEIRPPDGRGFFCPQCGARYCSLPVECRICKLTLISAPQLARSLHNLLPLPAFEEVDTTEGTCFACIRQLDDKSFVCRSCKSMFCIDCDVLLHESLQICPSCKSGVK